MEKYYIKQNNNIGKNMNSNSMSNEKKCICITEIGNVEFEFVFGGGCVCWRKVGFGGDNYGRMEYAGKWEIDDTGGNSIYNGDKNVAQCVLYCCTDRIVSKYFTHYGYQWSSTVLGSFGKALLLPSPSPC